MVGIELSVPAVIADDGAAFAKRQRPFMFHGTIVKGPVKRAGPPGAVHANGPFEMLDTRSLAAEVKDKVLLSLRGGAGPETVAMMSFNWVITLPPHLTADEFDTWYLGIHTNLAKVAHKIIRYNINRRVADQPAAAHGEFFRIAQEYWEDWDSMVECWNHPTGWALLGDGLVNMGLGSGTLPGIALTEHTLFDVASPAAFSTFRRGYHGRPDGTITRFIAFGLAKDKAGIKDWYAGRFADLGADPLVREHVFGTSVGKVIELGMVGRLPDETMLSYDWNLELWFDSNADAHTFLASEPFLAMFDELKAASTESLGGLFRGQEMLVQNTALPHRDD